MSLTVRALATLQPGKWLTEPGNRNEGALRAKGGPNGTRLYYRYRDSSGRYDDLPIGSFDASGKRGMTLEQARARVRDLRDRYLAGDRDLRLSLEADARASARQREEAAQAEAEADAKARATLGALLSGYIEQLHRDGKTSARSVERTVHNHVRDAAPEVWNRPAEDVTIDDLLAVIGRLTDDGKLREAAKLRSYIKAAYAAAIRARQDARGLPALRALRLSHNPAADLVTVEGASNARERALSLAELRAYWKRICDLPDPVGALLQFHLLTGGQRVQQLSRLTMDDYDPDLQMIRIRDRKGRRKAPRLHDVPLIPAALQAMRAMGHDLGPYVFTVNAGESGAAYHTVQHRLRAVVDAMEQAGELEKGLFTAGDIRRTIETRLSAVGVQPFEMAQLQSHGLGGVQSRHYNRHDYLEEKRAALETLYRLLTGKKATVTRIKSKTG